MTAFPEIVITAFVAALVENIIFSRAMGTSTMLVAAKNKNQLVGFGIAISYISAVASVLTYLADKLFLGGNIYGYLRPMVYILCISAVYIITLLVMWRFAKSIFASLKKFVHLSAFNCAVLGTLFLNSNTGKGLLDYLVFGLFSGLGFMLAAYFLKIAHERMSADYVPASFRGYPLMFVYIGILSMAFYALLGHRIVL